MPQPQLPGFLAKTGMRSAALTIILLLSLPAAGFDMDSDLPVKVEADNARLDDRAGEARYSGNVVITQGETRLEADEVRLFREAGELSRMVASGEPATYTQPESEDGFAMSAEGRTITYTREDGLVTFEKNAIIRHDGDTFRGDVIHYEVAERVVTARGTDADSETRGRVEMTIQPRSRQQREED